MRETLVQSKVRAVLNAPTSPVRVWRNNVGQLPNPGGAGYIKFGLAVGSADLIGMIIGKPGVCGTARFLAVEVKTMRKGSKQSAEQIAWQACVERMGGIYVVLRSETEAAAFVDAVRKGRYAVG